MIPRLIFSLSNHFMPWQSIAAGFHSNDLIY